MKKRKLFLYLSLVTIGGLLTNTLWNLGASRFSAAFFDIFLLSLNIAFVMLYEYEK